MGAARVSCPYCKRPRSGDGSINHIGGCAGLANIRMTRLQHDAQIADYRRKDAAHEHMVGRLYELMLADDWDGVMDIVRDEYRAIHGPSDE